MKGVLSRSAAELRFPVTESLPTVPAPAGGLHQNPGHREEGQWETGRLKKRKHFLFYF